MPMLVLQTVLLVAIAFILGCTVGYMFRLWFGKPQKAASEGDREPAASPAPVAAASAPPAPAPAPVKSDRAKSAPVSPAAVKPASKTQTKRKAPAKKPARTKTAAKRTAGATAKAPAGTADTHREPDDLKQIKGIGRQIEAKLNDNGVNTFAQIANWSASDRREMNQKLVFSGRIEREEWVKQARKLARSGTTTFSGRVAAGEGKSSLGKAPRSGGGKKPKMLKKARRGKADKLTRINGIGSAIEKKLFDIGVFHFDQIAKWSGEEAEWIGNEIGFTGRVTREKWVSKAQSLARGGATANTRSADAAKVAASRKATATQGPKRGGK